MAKAVSHVCQVEAANFDFWSGACGRKSINLLKQSQPVSEGYSKTRTHAHYSKGKQVSQLHSEQTTKPPKTKSQNGQKQSGKTKFMYSYSAVAYMAHLHLYVCLAMKTVKQTSFSKSVHVARILTGPKHLCIQRHWWPPPNIEVSNALRT